MKAWERNVLSAAWSSQLLTFIEESMHQLMVILINVKSALGKMSEGGTMTQLQDQVLRYTNNRELRVLNEKPRLGSTTETADRLTQPSGEQETQLTTPSEINDCTELPVSLAVLKRSKAITPTIVSHWRSDGCVSDIIEKSTDNSLINSTVWLRA